MASIAILRSGKLLIDKPTPVLHNAAVQRPNEDLYDVIHAPLAQYDAEDPDLARELEADLAVNAQAIARTLAAAAQ